MRNQREKKSDNSGFTLIEMLIVVLLLGVFAAVAMDTFTSIMRAQNKARMMNELEQSGSYALSVMEQEIRDARSIIECTAEWITIKSRGETVTFKHASAPSGEVPVRRVVVTVGVATETPLVNTDPVNGVQLTDTGYWNLFDCDGNTVKITLRLLPAINAPSRQDFDVGEAVVLQTTVVVRGEYR